MAFSSLSRSRVRYFVEEGALFFFFNYLILEGGVSNGIVSFVLNQATFWLVATVGAAWLGWRLWRRRTFPATPLDLAWVLMLGSYLVATFFSTDPRRSAIEFSQLLLIVLAFYILVDLLRAGWPGELLEKIVILTTILPVLLSLIQLGMWYSGWITANGWSHPIPSTTFRVSAFIANPNYSAAYFNVLLPIGVIRAFREKSRGKRAGWIGWTMLALFLIFMTSSRGGWLGTIGVFFSLAVVGGIEYRKELLCWWKGTRFRGVLIGIGVVVILGIIGLTLAFFAWQTRSTTSAGSGLSILARRTIWIAALDTIRAHPLIGNGPFTYGTEWIRHNSTPPSAIMATAHNHLLNVAAEAGIAGVAALGFMLLMVGRMFARRWKSAMRPERLTLTGILASFAGLAIHSQFDTPVFLPAIGLLVVSLLAIPASAEIRQITPIKTKIYSYSLVLVSLLSIAGLGWSLWGYSAAIRGVEASTRGDWASTAQNYDTAAQRDPSLAFNWFQAGFAHGRLGLNPDGSMADQNELDLSIASYARGIQIEPLYAVNWINYAVVQWAAGDRVSALNSAQKAVERAPRLPVLRLTYGRMLETTGDIERAGEAYRQALAQNPGWVHSYFFRATPLRREIAAEQGNSLAQDPSAQTANHRTPSEEELKAAIITYPAGWVFMQSQFGLGKLYSQQGKADQAITAYELALQEVEKSTSYGIGTLGGSPYGWAVYNRESIAPDLLPGVDQILYDDSIVAAMLDLGANYYKIGKSDDAVRVYNQVIGISPDNEVARQRLASIE